MSDIKSIIAQKEKIQLKAGGYAVASGDVVLSTLLGSCVSVCLFDPVNRIVGLNHFMLASRKYIPQEEPYKSEAGRYGVNAMELLINAMLAKGAEKRFLKAKAFGGASLFPAYRNHSDGSVGEINIRFTMNFLKREKIPLIASSFGGTQGMVIHFFSEDFSVYLKKVGPDRSSEIVAEEYILREEILETQRRPAGRIELWDD